MLVCCCFPPVLQAAVALCRLRCLLAARVSAHWTPCVETAHPSHRRPLSPLASAALPPCAGPALLSAAPLSGLCSSICPCGASDERHGDWTANATAVTTRSGDVDCCCCHTVEATGASVLTLPSLLPLCLLCCPVPAAQTNGSANTQSSKKSGKVRRTRDMARACGFAETGLSPEKLNFISSLALLLDPFPLRSSFRHLRTRLQGARQSHQPTRGTQEDSVRSAQADAGHTRCRLQPFFLVHSRDDFALCCCCALVMWIRIRSSLLLLLLLLLRCCQS
jgi:hypothetical protein